MQETVEKGPGMIELSLGLWAILMVVEVTETRREVHYTLGRGLLVCGGQAGVYWQL